MMVNEEMVDEEIVNEMVSEMVVDKMNKFNLFSSFLPIKIKDRRHSSQNI